MIIHYLICHFLVYVIHGHKNILFQVDLTLSVLSSAGKAAPGFGIGALEELDAEDEDVYATG